MLVVMIVTAATLAVMVVMLVVMVVTAAARAVMVMVLMVMVVTAVALAVVVVMFVVMVVIAAALAVMVMVLMVMVVVAAAFAVVVMVFVVMVVVAFITVVMVMRMSAFGEDFFLHEVGGKGIAVFHRLKNFRTVEAVPRSGDDNRVLIMLADKLDCRGELFFGYILGTAQDHRSRAFNLVIIEFSEVFHVQLAF